MANILFIGNCFLYHSLYYLQYIFEHVSSKDLYIELLYTSGGSSPYFDEMFEKPLNVKNTENKFIAKKVVAQNVLYKFGNGKCSMSKEKMPDTTIKALVESRKWDEIIICDNLKHAYDGDSMLGEMKTAIKSFTSKLRSVSDAEIIYFDSLVPQTPDATKKYMVFDKAEYEKSVAKAFPIFDALAEASGCDRRIPMGEFYANLINAFPDCAHHGMMCDGRHPDWGMGRWAMAYFIYEWDLRKYLGAPAPYVSIPSRILNRERFQNDDGSHPIAVNAAKFIRLKAVIDGMMKKSK